MSILKSFTFVLLIFSSFIVGATSYTVDLNAPSQTSDFIANTDSSFSDDWTLTVASGTQVMLSFSPVTNLMVPVFGTFNINDFQVDNTGTWSKLFLTNSNINVTGVASGAGGFYNLVSTVSTVSAVPVPAAVWMMGTALVGLVSFGRRKAAALVA